MKKFLIIAVALIAGIFIFLTVYKKQPVEASVTTEQVQDTSAPETQPAPEVASTDVAAPVETATPVEAPAS